MGFFNVQLLAASPSQTIEFGAPPGFRHAPLGFNPSPVLQPMQCGIKRALFEGKAVFRNHRDAFGNIPAVQSRSGESSQDEEIEGALEKFVSHFVHAGILLSCFYNSKLNLSKLDNKQF
jgi:hypothetical protein